MSLHPASVTLPSTTKSDRLLLRPLRTTDVAIDYAAVMASAAQLRLWSDSDWPADDFTLAGNLPTCSATPASTIASPIPSTRSMYARQPSCATPALACV